MLTKTDEPKVESSDSTLGQEKVQAYAKRIINLSSNDADFHLMISDSGDGRVAGIDDLMSPDGLSLIGHHYHVVMTREELETLARGALSVLSIPAKVGRASI